MTNLEVQMPLSNRFTSLYRKCFLSWVNDGSGTVLSNGLSQVLEDDVGMADDSPGRAGAKTGPGGVPNEHEGLIEGLDR